MFECHRDLSLRSRKDLMKLYAHQFRHHCPLLPRVAPDRNGVQVFKRVEVAFIHRLLFFQINLADEITIIATDYIRIVFGHSVTLWGWPIVELFLTQCTKVVNLAVWDI